MKNIDLYQISKEYVDVSNVSDCIIVNEKIYTLKNGQVWCYNKQEKTNHEIGICSKQITKLQHLLIEEAVYLCTPNEVAFINVHTDEISMFEFHSKMNATAWNPSQDLLVVIFENSDIGLFTFNLHEKTYHIKESSNLEFECPESITIGWGSTKTQFRGPLKKKTDDVLTLISNVLINDESEIEPPSELDDKRPIITWRSDGEIFCVNFWRECRRIIKFFDSECLPLFENSGVNGLCPVLAWRPFGGAIASICVVKNKSFLVLFEKNATIRYEFLLEHQLQVEDLKWDQSGNILSTLLKNPGENSSQIRIYMIRNNHLYLKQTLMFDSTTIVNFQWLQATSISNSLTVVVPNYFLKYHFRLFVNKMYVNDYNCTIVGVIDGHTLHLCRHTQSDCSSYKDITLHEPINSVIFYEDKKLLLIWAVNNIYFYNYQNIENNPSYLGKILANQGTFSPQLFSFHLVHDSSKILLKGVHPGSQEDTNTFEIDFSNLSEDIFKKPLNDFQENSELNQEVLINSKQIYYEAIKTCKGEFKLTMDEYKNVYLNSKLIWNNITSFIVHHNYLFQTTKDVLIGIRLNTLDDFFTGKITTSYTRTIEMGSVLICGMGFTSNLILQAPRGNIEIISCLLINIDNVDSLLENGNWEEAWDIVRVLKLNSNILFDLKPKRFLENIHNFVEASVLTVFLSELEEDNVFSKVYTTSGYKSEKFDKKVETVCKNIINFLVKNDYVQSLTTIVHACLVMKTTNSSVKDALRHIQTLFRYDTKNNEINKSVDDAIKFMLKYVHIREAYQAALSIYDLELAILIARHSEMDPKEYIDFITKLKNLPEMERNFTLNDFLGNHQMALFYLYELCLPNGRKNNIIEYMKKHNLEKDIYENISETSPVYLDVVYSYGEKLSSQKLFEEAAIILEKAKAYEKALESYKQAGNWRKSIEMMKLLKTDEINFKRNIKEITEHLLSIKQDIDVSFLYENYLGDYENAIKLLSEKHHFNLAHQMAIKHSRLDLVETNICPPLQDYTVYIYTQLEELRSDYRKYKERLLKVRKEKVEKLKHEEENKDNDFQENYQISRGIEDDLHSLAGSMTSTKYGSSIASNTSRSSTTSSRSRRKEQRKKEDLREGGHYEDIALMKAIHEKISTVCNYSTIVREVCLMLFKLNFENDARKLHNLLYSLQEEIKKEVKEIWPDTLLKQDDPHSYEIRALQKNLFSLDPAYWKSPVIKTDWVINILKNNC